MLPRPPEKNCCKILIAADNSILRRGVAAVVCSIAPEATTIEVSSFREAEQQLGLASFRAGIFDLDMQHVSEPSNFQTLRFEYPNLILTVISRDDRASAILSY